MMIDFSNVEAICDRWQAPFLRYVADEVVVHECHRCKVLISSYFGYFNGQKRSVLGIWFLSMGTSQWILGSSPEPTSESSGFQIRFIQKQNLLRSKSYVEHHPDYFSREDSIWMIDRIWIWIWVVTENDDLTPCPGSSSTYQIVHPIRE